MTIIDEREKTHGRFRDVSETYCSLKEILLGREAWANPCLETSLDMIAMKLARIIAGDSDFVDHWRDIAGYAELVVRELEDMKAARADYPNFAADHAPDCEWHHDQYAGECTCGVVK